MNLGDWEKGFRALAKALDRVADPEPMESVRKDVLGGLATALYSAANDLEDQQRALYDLPPKHGDSNGE